MKIKQAVVGGGGDDGAAVLIPTNPQQLPERHSI